MQTEIIEKIAKLLSGEATQTELNEINAWRNESAAHDRYFNECRECWLLAEETPLSEIIGKNKTWEQIAAQIGTLPPMRTYSKGTLLRMVSMAAAVTVLLTSSIFLVSGYRKRMAFTESAKEVVITAPTGQKAKVFLPDRSGVWLNSGTILSYRTDFGITERTVKISGEAFFDVSRDESKPFCVQAGDIVVHVLGTRFNINSSVENGNTSISLLSGKVNVISAKNGNLITSLSPGQKAVVDNQTLSSRLSECDVALESIWQSEQLKIQMEPLTEVIRKMEYWYGVEIDLQPFDNDELYWFTIKDQSIVEMLNLIDRITPIDYTINDRHITIRCKN